MIFRILFLFPLSLSFIANAQRTNIGNDHVNLGIIQLPTNYVTPEQRVYQVVGASEIEIDGWETGENPSIRVVVQQPLMTMGEGSLVTNDHVTKNKEGKVTSTYKTYYVNSTNRGSRKYSIEGVKNEFVYEEPEEDKKDQVDNEGENKEEENPFLANTDIDPDSAALEIAVDLSKVVYTRAVSQTYTHKTSEGRSSSTAWSSFRNNQRTVFYNHRGEFRTYSTREIGRAVNSLYGYSPSEEGLTIKVIKNDKHPETEKFNQAGSALKQLIGSIGATTDVIGMASQFDLLINYYSDLVKNADTKDKNSVKIMHASLYNLAVIAYALDRHEDCIAYCDQYMEDAGNERPGRLLKRESTRLKALLEFHHMTQRHM